MIALCCQYDTVGVAISAGNESARPAEGLPAPKSPGRCGPESCTGDRLVPYLQELGRAHRKFGVRERHYEVFKRALLATLQRFATPRWNETAKHAWEMAYNRAATIMIEAAKDDAAESPAWWMATVTGIELRGPDIAVLTLQPEQPLNYPRTAHQRPDAALTAAVAYLLDHERPAARRAAPAARARGHRRAGQPGARAPGPGRRPARARRAGGRHDR